MHRRGAVCANTLDFAYERPPNTISLGSSESATSLQMLRPFQSFPWCANSSGASEQ